MSTTPSTELLDAARAVARAWRRLNEAGPLTPAEITRLQMALDEAILDLEDVALREEL